MAAGASISIGWGGDGDGKVPIPISRKPKSFQLENWCVLNFCQLGVSVEISPEAERLDYSHGYE